METIKPILERKKAGTDCTKQESAEIKQYIKNTFLMVGDGSIQFDEELQTHFPQEWNEAQDEIEAEERGDHRQRKD